ncbi:integrin alpha-3-like [Cynoglossus semilaevis]|uniref:integrin alpha-3-like n=1 Tax=Cynoglossus semilaevis TaxID=244447 RepID=UPI0004972C1D|nr:integrin alpha-3-like [Cynoglossus semilaevis]
MASAVCVLLCVCVRACVSFNVDTSFPLLKTGGDQTFFGLSVALHEDLRTGEHMLLVGAPLAGAEPGVPANRTGGVYSCPISEGQSAECSRMKLLDPEVNLSKDLIEDMWLGVSVVSQAPPGGRVLVCGHRFVKLYGPLAIRQMIGRCILRGNDLRYNDTDMNWQNLAQTCSHVGDVRGEVMCNAGISAYITQSEVIIGSPGSYEWQGNVHMTWLNPDDLFDSQKTSFINMKSRNLYIGYSVSLSQHVLSHDDVTIITGAPKDSKDDARGSVLLAVKASNRLLPRVTLRGQQTGSYFGNAVATADINNDGWDDLLVGAPFFFNNQQEVGGAVYVYMNLGGRFDSRPSQVLTGPVGSAFGMSLSAAGDLDQDGFMDFAVGAPFHQTGSVMIWRGSRDGISTRPSQVIHGSSVSPLFRTFGYSLSAGLDVDKNRYPDLLVGSLDDTVVLLRTRPVVHLSKKIQVSPEAVDPNNCHFCIQVQVCFSISFSSDQSHTENIRIQFTVAADVTSLKPRLLFSDNGQSRLSGFLTVRKRHCQILRVGLQSLFKNYLEPLVFSLNASLSEKLPTRRSGVQDLKMLPVLSHTPEPTRTQIHIHKACGSDNHCQSNLQMAAQFMDENQEALVRKNVVLRHNTSFTTLILEVNVSNVPSTDQPAEDAHGAVLNVSSSPCLVYSGVRTKGEAVTSSVTCWLQEMVLLCDLGNPFRKNQQVQILIIFQLKTNLEAREVQSVLQLQTLSEQPPVSPLLVSLLLDFWLQPSLQLLRRPGPAFYQSHVTSEPALKKTEDIGAQLIYVLQVDVETSLPSHLGRLQLRFDWPRAVSSGKQLMYVTQILVDSDTEPRCRPDNIINPLNLILSEEDQKRTKQSLDQEVEPVHYRHTNRTQSGQTKSYSLDCEHGAQCVTFTCPLLELKNSATVTVWARLWSSTMIEDFADARMVLVRGRVTLELQTNKTNIRMESQRIEIQVRVYPEFTQQLDSGALPWLLLLSALVGVSLLTIIALLLWKCGFFERHKAAIYQGRIEIKGEILDKSLAPDHAPYPPKHGVTS